MARVNQTGRVGRAPGGERALCVLDQACVVFVQGFIIGFLVSLVVGFLVSLVVSLVVCLFVSLVVCLFVSLVGGFLSYFLCSLFGRLVGGFLRRLVGALFGYFLHALEKCFVSVSHSSFVLSVSG